MSHIIKYIELESCTSTNDEAWKHISQEGPVLISSYTQTKGRGRQGREWRVGQKGNIAVSYAFVPKSSNLQFLLSWLPLAAGVATIESLQDTLNLVHSPVKVENLRIKWPNDIYICNDKLGGILCESKLLGDQCTGLVVGLGFNLLTAPAIPNATSFLQNYFKNHNFNSESLKIIRYGIIFNWVEHFEYWLKKLSENSFTQLKSKWKTLANLSNYSNISTHDSNGSIVNLEILDLDSSGKLIAKVCNTSDIILIDQAL